MIAISYIITPEAIFDSCLITKFPFCNYYHVDIYSIHVWLNLINMQTRSTNFMMQFAPTHAMIILRHLIHLKLKLDLLHS